MKNPPPVAKNATTAGSGTAQKPKRKSSATPGFNPYNTGKFDRSASWERISKNQR